MKTRLMYRVRLAKRGVGYVLCKTPSEAVRLFARSWGADWKTMEVTECIDSSFRVDGTLNGNGAVAKVDLRMLVYHGKEKLEE